MHFSENLIVMKYSTMPIVQIRYPLPVIYLNHIPIWAYIMTYLTARIVTERNMHRNYTFSYQKPIHRRKPFCDFEVFV